ncbi:DinB family protein [Deinococcus sp.]|uniref:DinB family protein n=1 Tax=Deinococcus sp. TaxID=47478 RepID=UPI003CC5D390
MTTLHEVVSETLPRLQAIQEGQAARQPAPDVWSAKQVLGHLIDSACNNHARWARMATQNDLSFPTWDQNAWMDVQDWQGRPWTEILALWHAYNLHLTRLAALLAPVALIHRARVGTLNGGEPMTLAELLRHYQRHLLHHLSQIWERTGG